MYPEKKFSFLSPQKKMMGEMGEKAEMGESLATYISCLAILV